MITRARTTDGVRLTFSLDLDRPVSVVGDFNGWDPAAHPLKPRTNGKRSAVVTLPAGGRHAFRYLAEGGHFFDDAHADGYEDNGYGGTHGLVVLAFASRVRPAASTAATPRRAAPPEAVAGPKASAPAPAPMPVPRARRPARPAAAAGRAATQKAKKPKR